MADLPSGLDRADGVTVLPSGGTLGTATPAGAITAQDQTGSISIDDIPIEELEDSPTIERAEQATITHQFRMSYTEAMNRQQYLGRGLVRQDSAGNLTKVLSCSVTRQRGNVAILTIVEEGLSFDNPPDQFQIIPVELGINIIKHPRYFYAFLGDGYGSTTEKTNQSVIRALQNYFEQPSAAYRDALTKLLKDSLSNSGSVGATPPAYTEDATTGIGSFDGLLSGTDLAKYAAMEIIQKYWRGEETPYIVGYQITWSQFFWTPQHLNPGGYIEDPIYDAYPGLPDYFWSTTFPPSSNTILDWIAAYNPQCYSSDGTSSGDPVISWLRKADEMEYERTWFKVTRTWIGSAFGFWDTQLYASTNRPSTGSDYLTTDSN